MTMLSKRQALTLVLALLVTPAVSADDATQKLPQGTETTEPAAPAANLAIPPSALRPQAEQGRAAGPELSLEAALRATQEHNPDLAAARAALVASDQISRKVWAGYLPQVSAAGSYTRNSTEVEFGMPDSMNIEAGFRVETDEDGNVSLIPNEVIPGGEPIKIQEYDQFGAQLQVSQPLFVAPLIPAIRNAYTAEEIARLSTEQVRRELLFGTAQAWYGAVGLKEAARVMRQQVALLREHLRSAEVAFKAGTVPQLAVLRAQIELGRAEQDVLRAENTYAAARGGLAVLMGRKDIGFEVPSFELPARAPGLDTPAQPTVDLQEALASRPDVQIPALDLEMRERNKKAVLARFLPVLAANWTYRYSTAGGFANERDTWAGMLTLSVPLFEGGLRFADLAEAEARIEEGLARIRSTENRVIQEIRQSLLDIATAQANLDKAREQVRLARANWDAVERAFQVGAVSAIDVADASTALQSAELGAVGEAVRLRVSEIGLAKAIGAVGPTAEAQ